MAKKSFNFRNGVQVDNDNFVVNSNGRLELELQFQPSFRCYW